MQEPLISFVIPCYNDDPEHLATAVESALAQNSGRIEVILVDDGSSRSDTIVALESLASAEVRLLRQENRGPGAARNAGIKAALGQYLVTLDADDFVNPEFIDACFRVLTPGVVLVYSAVLFHLPDGSEYLQVPEPALTLQDFMDENRISSCVFFPKSHADNVGGFFEDRNIPFEDYAFFVRMLATRGNPRAVYAPGAVLNCRRRAGSRSSETTHEQGLSLTRQGILRNTTSSEQEMMVMAAWKRLDQVNSRLDETKRLLQSSRVLKLTSKLRWLRDTMQR